jgi:Rad3-related DNA helicase
MTILDYFPGEPRKVQHEILTTIEAAWNEADIFVVQAPVASGKSRVAKTVANWANTLGLGAAILTPTNQLVEQYRSEFPSLKSMSKQSSYASKQKFIRAIYAFKAAKQFVSNYYIYLAHKAYRDVLIVDEAHNMLDMLTKGADIKLWQHLYGWPDDISTVADVLDWLENTYPDKQYKVDKVLTLRELLLQAKTQFLIDLTTENYRGEYRRVLKFTPLDARASKPVMWPSSKVQKIILLSATINEHDIYDMGLDGKRVVYIPCDSPIPAVSRPFTVMPAAKVSYGTTHQAMPLIASSIEKLMEQHKTCGVIHCTYSIARHLKQHLDDPRIMWHNQADKTEVYQEFLDSDPSEGRVLVASGMYEGLDLSYDLARWQCICKVPYVSLAEPVIKARLRERPESYAWWAIRSIVQATGRVCRTPTDYGCTYMLDANFIRLYRDNEHQFPDWFKHAIRT